MANEIYNFVLGKVKKLSADTPNNRALLAKLRRGVGKKPNDTPDVWEVTLPELPDGWRSNRQGEASAAELAIHTALTLYALHQQGREGSAHYDGNEEGTTGGHSFGAAAAKLVQPDESNLSAIKRRFNAVATAADFTELAHHARGIVQLLRAGDNLTMNYPRFAQDLFYFQLPRRSDGVRLKWGEDFYRILSQNRQGKEEKTQ